MMQRHLTKNKKAMAVSQKRQPLLFYHDIGLPLKRVGCTP